MATELAHHFRDHRQQHEPRCVVLQPLEVETRRNLYPRHKRRRHDQHGGQSHSSEQAAIARPGSGSRGPDHTRSRGPSPGVRSWAA